MLSDGHASRFNAESLSFSFKENIKIFLSPPDTTAVTQPLDQINASLHSSYAKEVQYVTGGTINREAFME